MNYGIYRNTVKNRREMRFGFVLDLFEFDFYSEIEYFILLEYQRFKLIKINSERVKEIK